MKAEDVAQWVIDNRYPKNENDKVSDHELYHGIIERIAKVKNLAQPDVSGQFCGTCETELQLWNVKFKQWYCPQCRSYVPQYFR